MFGLVDPNARSDKNMEGGGDGRVLGAYERDELTRNGKRVLASSLALTLFQAHGRVENIVRSKAFNIITGDHS